MLRASKRIVDHTRQLKNKGVKAILILKFEEICQRHFFRKFPIFYEKYCL